MLNSKGYLVKINNMYGSVRSITSHTIYYSDTGCQVTKYIRDVMNGTVLRDPSYLQDYEDDIYFYVEKGAIPEEITYQSYKDGSQCTDHTYTSLRYPLLLNDESLTGVGTSLFDLPITIE